MMLRLSLIALVALLLVSGMASLSAQVAATDDRPGPVATRVAELAR